MLLYSMYVFLYILIRDCANISNENAIVEAIAITETNLNYDMSEFCFVKAPPSSKFTNHLKQQFTALVNTENSIRKLCTSG